jgi:hypothetical protein
MKKKDSVITGLVAKKKELLNHLLTFSIQSVLESPKPGGTIAKRTELLKLLEKNDKAILVREKQTGNRAHQQELQLHSEIATLLDSIKDNNHLSLANLESAIKESEQEKQRLGKETRISSYVRQTKAFSQFGSKKKSNENRSKLLKGFM